MARPTHITLVFLFILLTLTGCFSLAEDITPPPGAELPPPVSEDMPAPEPVADAILPDQLGDPARGAPIYTEKCAPCHGDSGMGDGAMTQNISGGVPEIGSPDLMRQATPLDWYGVVSEGNPDPDRIMPAFNSLSDLQRWDVVAYAFTLSITPEFSAQGQDLFSENCAECHGQDGRQGAVDFTNPQRMSELSATDLFEAISIGHGEMPGFGDLSENERWALTAHLRTLSFAGSQLQAEASASEAKTEGSESPSEVSAEDSAETSAETMAEAPADGVMDIRVQITNGTAGAVLPSDLEVTLRGYDNMNEVYTQTIKTNGGDEVIFEGVEVLEGRLFFATMEYGNATFGSDVHTSADGAAPDMLEIVYYQPTTDPSILSVDRLHIFVDFIDENTIEIYQLYIFSNLSDQVLTPAESDQPAVTFKIPSDALNFNVEENMAMLYMKTDEGFGILNVYPDEDQYQTLFSFQLPYDKNLDLELPVGMDAKALVVMVPDNGVKVSSDRLTEMGTQAIEGVSFNLYNGNNLSAGEMLSLEISGRPKMEGTKIISNLEGSSNSLVIGLAGFGVALIAAGVVLWRRNRAAEGTWSDELEQNEPIEETPEDIIDAIITLDDQYKNGELPEGAYQQRRAELKERLRKLVS